MGNKIYFASDFHLGVPTLQDSIVREKYNIVRDNTNIFNENTAFVMKNIPLSGNI